MPVEGSVARTPYTMIWHLIKWRLQNEILMYLLALCQSQALVMLKNELFFKHGDCKLLYDSVVILHGTKSKIFPYDTCWHNVRL